MTLRIGSSNTAPEAQRRIEDEILAMRIRLESLRTDLSRAIHALSDVLSSLAENPDKPAVVDLSPSIAYNDSTTRMRVLFCLEERGFAYTLAAGVVGDRDAQGFLVKGYVELVAHVVRAAERTARVEPYVPDQDVLQAVLDSYGLTDTEDVHAGCLAAIAEYEKFLGLTLYGLWNPAPKETPNE